MVLKFHPIQVVISLPLWMKLIMSQLLLLFLCTFWSFFSYSGGVLVSKYNRPFYCYWLIYFGYSVYFNAQSIDILNCLRSVGIIVLTTESGLNSLKVVFTGKLPTKASICQCFDVFSVRPPQIFQVQVKISSIWPVFLDYLSVFYDYV